MAERWIVTINGASSVLPVTNRQGAVRVISQETPAPAPRVSWAPRTEGQLPTARDFENRTVTLGLVVERPTDQWWDVAHDFGAPPAEAEGDGTVPGFTGSVRRVDGAGSPIIPAVRDLAGLVGAVQQAPTAVAGSLTRVMESGDRIVFDLVDMAMTDGPTWGHEVYLRDETRVTLTCTCLPFARGPEVLLGTVNRTTNGRRLLELTNLTVPGDVPALARLVLANGVNNQASVLYAIDQSTVPLERWCSSLGMPPAATLVSGTGALAAQAVRRAAYSLTAGAGLWEQGVLLTESGAPLSCPGRWRVMLRVRGQQGARVRLRWSAGSRASGLTAEQPVTLASNQWELVTLGVISVPDGDTLDGVIEARLPHSQPIDYDSIVFVPADLQGEQHASRGSAPSELIAADLLTGSGALNGTAPPVGGSNWASAGTGTAAVRAAVGATRTNVYSGSSGIAHYTSLASPGGAVVRAVVDTDRSGTYGDVGIWVANAAGRAAIAGSQSEPGTPAAGASGAWGASASWCVSEEQMRWTLAVISGTVVTSITGYQPVASGETVELELTVSGTAATMRALVNGVERLTQSLQVAAIPSGLEAGITSHGWTGASGAKLVRWRDWSAASVPAAGDAALFGGRSAEHATGGARRMDGAFVWGPVMPVGSRPVLPAAGPNDLKARVVVMATRGQLQDQIDYVASDQLSLVVYATPRYLQVPG